MRTGSNLSDKAALSTLITQVALMESLTLGAGVADAVASLLQAMLHWIKFCRLRRPIGNFCEVICRARTFRADQRLVPMTEPTRHYRCDVHDFVSDLMDFNKDQISRAIDDPLDQFAATHAARD
jgi:hypothetical protein